MIGYAYVYMVSVSVAKQTLSMNPKSRNMTEALLSSVIHKLSNLLVEESGMKELYAKIINNLRTILDFLREWKLGKKSRIRYLISDVIEVAIDLDKGKLRTEPQMVSVQTWLEWVTRRVLQFGAGTDLETAESSSSNSEISESISVGEGEYDAGDVVGMEKDVERMLQRAILNVKQGERLRACVIKGMVGIGKTTLARQLYNHPTVVQRFQRAAWARVSSYSSHKELLMKLIEQVVNCVGSVQTQRDSSSFMKKMECADNQSLQQMLHQHLRGMRYFIVIDDWLKVMRLESIMKALPDQKNGSRLLLTCSSYVKEANIGVSHHMRTLDHNQSWQLFLKTIHRGSKFTVSEDDFPKQLEEKGKELLRSCGGLPLAIKHVGRQIAEKRRSAGTEWEQLLESIDLGSTLELVEPIYHKLDPEVKLCFLHLAFFKEDATMRHEKLAQICSAGGIVSNFEANVLLDESIITLKYANEFGNNIKSYHINSMLHKLSVQKAKEEIGFENSTGDSRPCRSTPRHRVVICGREKYHHSTNQDKHLVSLFFHGGGFFEAMASPSYWKSFAQLKTLDLEDFGIKVLPESIGTLAELRYLGLRNNYLQQLPDALGCLKELEVLDIAQNFMVEVPNIIWEMGSLRHLYMSDVISRKPLRIEALQSLESLTYISVDNWTYDLSGLQLMPNLRKLGIEDLEGNSNVSKLFASLAELSHLQHLIIRGFRFTSMPGLDDLRVLKSTEKLKVDGRLSKLPTAHNFPLRTCELKLVNCMLNEDPMPVLEKLPHLKNLKLRNAYTGRLMVISRNGFLKLKMLIIQELQNLRNIEIGEGAMSDLNTLKVNNCPNLETLPEKIGSISYLVKLKIKTTKHIATNINNYGHRSGSFSNIRHVDINCVT